MAMNLTAEILLMKNNDIQINKSLNDFFLVTMGIVVFLMQAGFAFLEAGAVRSKNATNILTKNLFDSMFGCLAYWLIGYALAFGDYGNPFCGGGNFALAYLDPAKYSLFFFQYVFAATATTIVSGAVAERCRFVSYVIYSIVISGFIYPIVSHWAWDETGWLKKGVVIRNALNIPYQASYQDFAGSGVVHIVGGLSALIAAIFLGPRIGRFSEGEEDHVVIRGHSVPLASLGGFILMFGFFAFNGGSQLAISNAGDGEAVALSMVNTIISAAMGSTVCLLIERFIRMKNWSILVSINGALTGMVAICAGCNVVYPWGACIIGFFAGWAYIAWEMMMEYFKVDDPLNAVAVHLGGGLLGVISVAFLNKNKGILFKWDTQSGVDLLWQFVGILTISLWTGGLSLAMFATLKYTKMFRVNPEMEELGLDIVKHNERAYPEQEMTDEENAMLRHYINCDKKHQHAGIRNSVFNVNTGFDNSAIQIDNDETEEAAEMSEDQPDQGNGDFEMRRID